MFKWTEGSRYNGDPNVVGERLQTLSQTHGGNIDPEVVVEDARPVDSPLHPYFEWDINEAARQYNLEQARRLLRAVVLVQDVPDLKPTRAFVHVSNTYKPIQSVLSSEDLRAELLETALRELQAFKVKYRDLKELCKVFEVIDQSLSAS